ncbi:esterase/lipase family protein [Butyrivibrio sp. AE2032]|uniref:esterase/lipase family protein n=1 Tax=Butyrivibrio sp. AE2032 TaxID=1458463 RepID=UPI00068BEEE5|nr:alpha/beta fold hydrolase [Butyrivibrio sp. AE2032]
MGSDCDLRYPLLMVHGMGFRDRKHLCYWGRVPKTLESLGARVFFGNQDSVGSIESNADTIAKSLDEALRVTGADKVNILAHSKGGLEAKYLVNHGYQDKIASITTIDTPHHGSHTIDFLMKSPKWMVKTAAWGTDLWMKILGDKHPDSYKCFDILTTGTAEQFDIDNPAPEGIYCQSYAFKCESAFSDPVFCITFPVVSRFDGENDGMVSVASSRWANFKGVHTSSTRRGISHADVVDLRRRRFTSRLPSSDTEVSDIAAFYVGVVKELKAMGF